MALASFKKTCPPGVSEIGRVVRSISAVPILLSSAWICWVMAVCEMNYCVAALVKLWCSATATKYLS